MIDLSMKHAFFDRKVVIDAVGKARSKAMLRIGGYIRLTSRRSIRKRKGSSKPGSPPHSHVGLLRQHIYFSYDFGSKTVVIGPALITTPGRRFATPDGDETVPSVLEYGGSVNMRRRSNRPGQFKKVIAARPYMGPALDAAKNADKLSAAWKGVVSQ